MIFRISINSYSAAAPTQFSSYIPGVGDGYRKSYVWRLSPGQFIRGNANNNITILKCEIVYDLKRTRIESEGLNDRPVKYRKNVGVVL